MGFRVLGLNLARISSDASTGEWSTHSTALSVHCTAPLPTAEPLKVCPIPPPRVSNTPAGVLGTLRGVLDTLTRFEVLGLDLARISSNVSSPQSGIKSSFLGL